MVPSHTAEQRDARSDIEWWFCFRIEMHGKKKGRLSFAYLRSVGLWSLLRLGVDQYVKAKFDLTIHRRRNQGDQGAMAPPPPDF